jgi:hypothetical protein
MAANATAWWMEFVEFIPNAPHFALGIAPLDHLEDGTGLVGLAARKLGFRAIGSSIFVHVQLERIPTRVLPARLSSGEETTMTYCMLLAYTP